MAALLANADKDIKHNVKTVDNFIAIPTNAVNPGTAVVKQENTTGEGNPGNGWRYWAVIIALCVTGLLSAMEGTVVPTALPTIVHDLGGGELYVWVVNAYFLTSTALQPLYGQTANILGRRWLIIFAIVSFMLGSGISGGASSMTMLIAGRTVQGIGGGGISMLIDLIVCDLVPLRKRGSVIAIIFGAITVGTALGPFLGGIIVQTTSWRWVFWLNLPIGAVAFILLLAFLQVNYEKESTWREKIKRIDFAGNAIFILSVISILCALTNGGTSWLWLSWRTIFTLIIGFTGLGLFYIFETSKLCVEPTLPPQLFANRTSATAFTLTFIHTFLMYWAVYFLPVYFQAVLGSSPARSGVQLLPTVITLMAFAAVGGGTMQQLGRYRPIHHTGFALMTIGLGTFSILDATSAAGTWVVVQIVFAAGIGLSIGTLLPAAQAALSESDTATATGLWAVLRSFGTIWAITISAVVFNNRFASLSGRISDPTVRALLSGGQAYEHATGEFIGSFGNQSDLQKEIVSVYTDSLKLVWQVAITISGLGFLLIFAEKEITLRTELDTNYGLTESKNKEENQC
ncbi:MAG: hypothetical protein Q9187_002006 [Circinaria calcarea]